MVSIEVVLSCILTMVFSTTLTGRNHSQMDLPGIKTPGFRPGAWQRFSAWHISMGAAWFHIDRIIAGLVCSCLLRHSVRVGACAGHAAGLALSAGSPGSFISLAGMYGISGMTAGLFTVQKRRQAVFSSWCSSCLLYCLLTCR